jgi:hypothetical protein
LAEEESNLKHEHFIRVLEEALATLLPFFEKPEAPPKANNVADGTDLNNRFDSLGIYDLDDEELGTTTHTSDNTTSGANNTNTPQVECEESLETELPFMVFCLFEDLHRSQDFLTESWKSFAAANIDLMTVCLITNIAIEGIRASKQHIQGLARSLDSTISQEHPWYASMTAMLHPMPDLNELFAKRQRNPIEDKSHFSKFVYWPIFLILEKYCRKVQTSNPHWVLSIDCCIEYEVIEREDDMIDADRFLSQMLLDLDMAICPKDFQKRQQMDEKRELLNCNGYKVSDEITKALRWVVRSGTEVCAVFTCRILLDIRHILRGRIAEPYQELCHRGAKAYDELSAN